MSVALIVDAMYKPDLQALLANLRIESPEARKSGSRMIVICNTPEFHDDLAFFFYTIERAHFPIMIANESAIDRITA